MKIKFIVFLFLIGCSKISSNSSNSCANNGNIDFMYINVPCEECVIIIEELLDSNLNIFDYNIVRNKENHILINYCYNSKNTDSFSIEQSIADIGLVINQGTINNQIIHSDAMCCKSQ